jgi:hypothetical protein
MKKPEPEKHQRPVTFYVSAEEYKEIALNGAVLFGSVSNYVRSKLGLEPIWRGAPRHNTNRSALWRQHQLAQAFLIAERDMKTERRRQMSKVETFVTRKAGRPPTAGKRATGQPRARTGVSATKKKGGKK